jgi:MFS family permease
LLVSTAAAWSVLQLGRFYLPLIVPSLIADVGITPFLAGLIMSVLQGTYALTQYPSGKLSDQLSRVTLVLPGLVVIVLAFLVFSQATLYPLLLLGGTLIGLGKGLFAVPTRALLSDHFVEQRGRALGIFSAGTDVGGIIASVIGATVVTAATWQRPFLPLAIALALCTALYAYWNQESFVVERRDLQIRETVRRLVTTRRQQVILCTYSLFFFLAHSLIGFLPTYLQDVKGLSPKLASASFGLLFVIGLLVKPAAGALSDRFQRKQIAVVGFLLSALALASLLVVESTVAIALVIVAIAVGYKAQFPILDALLMDAAPEGDRGGDLGAARSLFMAVGALGPAYVGFVAGKASYDFAFAGLVGMLVVSAAVLWLWG